MRSSNKIAAMALALAIGSTMSAATAFAESEETPAAPAVSEEVTLAEADDENSEITENTPDTEETPSNVEKFGDVTVTIENGGSKITFYDAAYNYSMICVSGVMTVDGTVITTGSTISSDNSDRFFEILEMVDNMNITTMVFTDNVTEVRSGGSAMSDNITQVKFGKNISYIADDMFSGFNELKSVHGYKGTAAETFANANNLEFVALDAPIPVSTTTAAPSTTTANNATTTASDKKATTTSKTTSTKKPSTTTAAKTTTTATTTSSTSPKTGDHGVGAVAGVLGAAAVAFAVTRKKKHE